MCQLAKSTDQNRHLGALKVSFIKLSNFVNDIADDSISRKVYKPFETTTSHMHSEHDRQEKIINAIIDNEDSLWYSSMLSWKSAKRRTFSTFDNRQPGLVPKSVKHVIHSKNPSFFGQI